MLGRPGAVEIYVRDGGLTGGFVYGEITGEVSMLYLCSDLTSHYLSKGRTKAFRSDLLT